MKVAIVGYGLYGGYLYSKLKNLNKLKIDVYEVSRVKNKSQIHVKKQIRSNGKYEGASKGRFFGPGGTSNLWGGQLVFLDENKFDTILGNNIKFICKKFKKNVLDFFRINHNDTNKNNLISGYWLKSTKRSILNYSKPKTIQFYDIKKIIKNNDKTFSIFDRGDNLIASYDRVYLTTGSFEIAEILYNSNLIKSSLINFTDHISVPLVTVKDEKPNIFGNKINIKVSGQSIRTLRYPIFKEGFISLVFNEETWFFQFLKKILYPGTKINKTEKKSFFSELKFMMNFIYSYLFKKEIYIDYREWRLICDIEKKQKAIFDIVKKRIDWKLDKTSFNRLCQIQKKVINYYNLKSTLTKVDAIKFEKIIDSYHPVNFTNIDSNELIVPIDGKKIDGIFCFGTLMLPFCTYSNPSGTVFCLIEKHLDEFYFR